MSQEQNVTPQVRPLPRGRGRRPAFPPWHAVGNSVASFVSLACSVTLQSHIWLLSPLLYSPFWWLEHYCIQSTLLPRHLHPGLPTTPPGRTSSWLLGLISDLTQSPAWSLPITGRRRGWGNPAKRRLSFILDFCDCATPTHQGKENHVLFYQCS